MDTEEQKIVTVKPLPLAAPKKRTKTEGKEKHVLTEARRAALEKARNARAAKKIQQTQVYAPAQISQGNHYSGVVDLDASALASLPVNDPYREFYAQQLENTTKRLSVMEQFLIDKFYEVKTQPTLPPGPVGLPPKPKGPLGRWGSRRG